MPWPYWECVKESFDALILLTASFPCFWEQHWISKNSFATFPSRGIQCPESWCWSGFTVLIRQQAPQESSFYIPGPDVLSKDRAGKKEGSAGTEGSYSSTINPVPAALLCWFPPLKSISKASGNRQAGTDESLVLSTDLKVTLNKADLFLLFLHFALNSDLLPLSMQEA